jgi:hypothetical protein
VVLSIGPAPGAGQNEAVIVAGDHVVQPRGLLSREAEACPLTSLGWGEMIGLW